MWQQQTEKMSGKIQLSNMKMTFIYCTHVIYVENYKNEKVKNDIPETSSEQCEWDRHPHVHRV